MTLAIALAVVLGVAVAVLVPQFWSGVLGDPEDGWTQKLARRRTR